MPTRQIILQQIDVIVVGPKKYQFLQLVLQRQFKYRQDQTLQNGNRLCESLGGYIKILKKFFNVSIIHPNSINSQINIKNTTHLSSPNKSSQHNVNNLNNINKHKNKKQNLITSKNNEKQKQCKYKFEKDKDKQKQKQNLKTSREHSQQSQSQRNSLDDQGCTIPLGQKSFCGIQKFIKIIQTQSFWLTINFYVTDLKIYDPVLSEYTRGNISIGIIVGDDQSGLIDQIKLYLTGNNPINYDTIKQPTKISRIENAIQAKINSRIHNPCINGFNSLLCLRLRDQNRLVQETNNLRLTNNQIFRWIVDRYFQNKYRIKLKESLGDQIQRGSNKIVQHKNQPCSIM